MKIVFLLPSLFLYLYLFWKRLKEDYPPDLIFTCAFYSVGGVALANIVSFYLFPVWWFWLSFLGLSLGTLIGIIRFKFRIFEVIEAVVVAVLPVYGIRSIYDAIEKSSIESELASLLVLTLLALFVFIDTRYKRFIWYKSGRVGFSGLTVLGLFFIIRAIVAVGFVDMLSFVGAAEPFLSGAVALTCFLGVFYLSGKKT